MKIVRAERFDPKKKPWPICVIPWDDINPKPRDCSWGYIITPNGLQKHILAGDWIVTYEDGTHDVVYSSHHLSIYPNVAKPEDETESILKRIETLKYNARKQGIFITEIFLDNNNYMALINLPTVDLVIKTSHLSGIWSDELSNTKKHITWDGIHIVNNSLPLPEKKCLLNKAKEETKLVAEQLGYHKKLLDTKRSLVKISNSLIAVISKLER